MASPACAPIKTFFIPVVVPYPADEPTAVLKELVAVVKFCNPNDPLPIATISLRFVSAPNALYPTATLFLPVVKASPDKLPIKVLLSPVVTFSPAALPIATL